MAQVGFCQQCGKVFRGRSDKLYCGATCRKRAARGMEPQNWWESEEYDESKRYERIAEQIAQDVPEVYDDLRSIREKYGRRAMFAAMDLLATAGVISVK